MKTWTIGELNEKTFEFNTKETETETALSGYGGIHDAYSRPSHIKELIWYEWERWFNNNDGYCTIISRNSSFFSIAGYVTNKASGERYYCYITSAHNKCWKVV